METATAVRTPASAVHLGSQPLVLLASQMLRSKVMVHVSAMLDSIQILVEIASHVTTLVTDVTDRMLTIAGNVKPMQSFNHLARVSVKQELIWIHLVAARYATRTAEPATDLSTITVSPAIKQQ